MAFYLMRSIMASRRYFTMMNTEDWYMCLVLLSWTRSRFEFWWWNWRGIQWQWKPRGRRRRRAFRSSSFHGKYFDGTVWFILDFRLVTALNEWSIPYIPPQSRRLDLVSRYIASIICWQQLSVVSTTTLVPGRIFCYMSQDTFDVPQLGEFVRDKCMYVARDWRIQETVSHATRIRIACWYPRGLLKGDIMLLPASTIPSFKVCLEAYKLWVGSYESLNVLDLKSSVKGFSLTFGTDWLATMLPPMISR